MKEKIVLKRDGTEEKFDKSKIKKAVMKSANRVNVDFTEEELENIAANVKLSVFREEYLTVDRIHNEVEQVLVEVNELVARSYKDYRNYKQDYGQYLMRDIEGQVKSTLSEVDRSNSNSNTRYISTKRTEIAQTFSKEMFQKMHLPRRVVKALKSGFIYMHDLKDMLLPQFNCCLLDVGTILNGGFELEGYKYTEPKDIRTAVCQIGDIIQITSAQHFGGSTTPEIDKILAPYFKKSVEKLIKKYTRMGIQKQMIEAAAFEDAYTEMKQALQGLEMKLNTVVSARGSYPFTTFTFGNCDNVWEENVGKALLEVRMEGHGEKGMKKTVIFPKLVFLHDENKHGNGCEYRDLFDLAIECTSKCMYPDYIGWNHKHEGKYISPMGK